jgi:hypothetical protein
LSVSATFGRDGEPSDLGCAEKQIASCGPAA